MRSSRQSDIICSGQRTAFSVRNMPILPLSITGCSSLAGSLKSGAHCSTRNAPITLLSLLPLITFVHSFLFLFIHCSNFPAQLVEVFFFPLSNLPDKLGGDHRCLPLPSPPPPVHACTFIMRQADRIPAARRLSSFVFSHHEAGRPSGLVANLESKY